MKYATALKHLKSVHAIAELLKIKVQAVYKWQKSGVVPKLRAFELQEKTGGALQIEEEVYVRQRKKPRRAHP